MKLISFYVENMRGYITKKIHFRDSVTFLIGINGSGKTTVLKLLNGLLKPSLKELVEIEFTSLKLELEDRQKCNIILYSRKENDRVIIGCDNGQKKEEYSLNYTRYYLLSKSKEDYSFEDVELEKMYMDFSATSVYKEIRNIYMPVILGLSRTHFPQSSIIRNKRMPFHVPYESDREDDMTKALTNVQKLIYDFILDSAKKQSKMSEEFKDKVYDEMLAPINVIDFNSTMSVDCRQANQAKELLSKLSNDESMKKITNKISGFIEEFEDSCGEVFNSLKDKKHEYDENQQSKVLRLMMLGFQLHKIKKIAEYAKENSDKISDLRSPITRFINSVNLFLKESDKRIVVAGNGDLIVRNNKKRVKKMRIEELSSGEKQIVVLMAYLAFKVERNGQRVYIVDEPEVSLHITWQERFVDALLEACPDGQFILATHSPSIIAKKERRLLCEDLSISE